MALHTFFDIETTGLDIHLNKILSFGYLQVSDNWEIYNVQHRGYIILQGTF